MNRRGFLRGAGLLLAAPAIVRVGALMPVRAVEEPWRVVFEYEDLADVIRNIDPTATPFAEAVAYFRMRNALESIADTRRP